MPQRTLHTTASTLRRFLECYWLRPENAFWMTLRSRVLADREMTEPCVDLSCGDGIFSFLHARGELDPAFDVFTSVGRLDEVRDGHADMFDHAEAGYEPPVILPADHRMACGTDWKDALLRKAGALNFYERLVRCDHNEPLPFEDGSFTAIHCNSAYWVRRIGPFLAEMRRILRPGGRALLAIKLDSIKSCTLERHGDVLGTRWLEIIGRGRFETWPSMGGHETWARRFEAAGLHMVSATPFVTRTHAHIWDVGLRPIAPLLVRMANAISPENRLAIKQDWVDLMMELMLPITRFDLSLMTGGDEPVEVLYELTR